MLASLMLLICIVELESSTKCLRVTGRAGTPGVKHPIEVDLENYPAEIEEECSCRPSVAAICVIHVTNPLLQKAPRLLLAPESPRRLQCDARDRHSLGPLIQLTSVRRQTGSVASSTSTRSQHERRNCILGTHSVSVTRVTAKKAATTTAAKAMARRLALRPYDPGLPPRPLRRGAWAPR